jgi:hypothetical protein
MRMHDGRFARLTNAFSKKFETHARMVAIYAVWYDFLRIHKTIRMSPAMAAGICDTLITWEQIAEAMDVDQPAKERSLYNETAAEISKRDTARESQRLT